MSRKTIPSHLQAYVSKQDYDLYTPINQAVWRYVMRQNYHFFRDLAHESYQGGLEKSGISLDRIPHVDEMSRCLEPFGLAAVTIDGLIPGTAFFDFQGHGFLPIATEIRTLKHIGYTPAPDMLHEAGGHGPILSEPKFAEYVRLFGQIGAKAISSREEHELFLATRKLTQIMEDPASTPEMIAEVEKVHAEKMKAATGRSEATEISRLYWWTVEYGLVGTLDDPKIYGAGLLSSISEGQRCLSSDVEKIPFDVDVCMDTDFDVTKPQPHLFVCRDFDQLIEEIKLYGERMAYRVGGTESLEKALRSGQVTTSVYSSGLQVSGVVTELLHDEQGEAIYLRTEGGTQLSFEDEELPNQGCAVHHHGFSAPIGRVEGLEKQLEEMSLVECEEEGIQVGSQLSLRFVSGVEVEGTIMDMTFQRDRLILLSLKDCKVTWGDRVLFQPEWGTFDMPVGERIQSVYAGPADHDRFAFAEQDVWTVHKPEVVWTDLDDLYQDVRDLREEQRRTWEATSILARLRQVDPDDWLLRVEILELAIALEDKSLESRVRAELSEISERQIENRSLIDNGIRLAEQEPHTILVKQTT
ncbi:aromatic amino acid hydroxylase [Baia soyae]|uniref:Phenylalanine 4-hydroxylase n=1 Tax=Baia soyae TaxID=1544746 RepID=A0A4R2S2K4_9BACL|nr:aromatic amino acid hydroxylase [Baia soyae]TCP69925.1 phenylalanine 4-hydroxylase [Baia soyae]